MAKIDTHAARRKLKTQPEPHWYKLKRGSYIGYRKTKDGGTWIARCAGKEKRYDYKSLGELEDYKHDEQFDQAGKLALKWFDSIHQTSPSRYTVTMAAEEYLKHFKITKGPESEKRARWQIEKHITPALGNKLLEDLRHHHVNNWLSGMVIDSDDTEAVRKSQDSANRMLAMLKALLNFAKRNKHISTDEAWSVVQRFKKVGASRKVFLTEAQIARLLENTEGDFHNLVKGLLLTGMRPGKEPRHLTTQQFDPHNKTLDIEISKTGKRTVYLSDDAAKFFKELTANKLPKAPLFHCPDNKTLSRLMGETVKRAKLPQDTVLYTLRHTYISRAIVAGLPLMIIAENVGTSIKMIETHYGKFTSKFRHEMLNRVKLG